MPAMRSRNPKFAHLCEAEADEAQAMKTAYSELLHYRDVDDP